MEIPTQFQVSEARGHAGALAFARAMGIVGLVGGGAVLLGWHFDLVALKQVAPNLVAMKANSAVGIGLAGLALLLFTFKATRATGRLVGSLLVALGAVTLSQDVWSWNLGIDQLLFRELPEAPYTIYHGRMSPGAAMSFVLFGGVLLLGKRGWLASLLSDMMAGAVLAHALLVLIGYGYGVVALYYPFPFTAMAVHEAVLLSVLAAGIFAASPERGIGAAVVDPAAGGQMIRRILPGLIAVPVVLGWLRHQGELAGYYDTAVGTALFTASTIVLLGAFAWLTAHAVSRADRDRQRALDELHGQREWLSTTLASIGDAVIATDGNGAVLIMNRIAGQLTGWDLEAARGRPVWEVFRVVDEARRKPIEDPAVKALRERRGMADTNAILLNRDGKALPIEASAAPIISPDGQVAGAVVSFRDIAERRRNEQRQTMLMGELNHRVKNVLSIVHALVHASARHANGTTAEAMAEALSERLQSLSRAHELLLETRWSGASLKAMVERELAPYQRAAANHVAIKGADVLLPPQSTSVMAMTLHELATNAAKYGALSQPEGRLRIEWWVRGEKLHLIWRERVAMPVKEPESKAGFGLRLIDRGIRQNLGGTAKIEFRREGLHVEIALPLAQPRSDPQNQPLAAALSPK